MANDAIMKLSRIGVYIMRGQYRNTFREKVEERIKSLNSEVMLWSDLSDLGSSRQISRALKDFIVAGTLIRIGRGIYAKAQTSIYTNQPIIRAGFETVCFETLKRLNIEWGPSQLVKDYNEGKTQQIPVKFEVRLKSRFRRSLFYGKNQLQYERNINAK